MQQRSRAVLIESEETITGASNAAGRSASSCGLSTLQTQPCSLKRCSLKDTALNWWAYRTLGMKDEAKFSQYGAGSVRPTTGAQTGSFEGTMQLGFDGKWALDFRIKPSDDPQRDQQAKVAVFIDGQRVATVENRLAGLQDGSDPTTYDLAVVRPDGAPAEEIMVYGSSFHFRFEWISGDARNATNAQDGKQLADGMAVLMGHAHCRQVYAYNIALTAPGAQTTPPEMRDIIETLYRKHPGVKAAASSECDSNDNAGLGMAGVYAECVSPPRAVFVENEAPDAMKPLFRAGLRAMICSTSRENPAENWGYVTILQQVGVTTSSLIPWHLCEPGRKSFGASEAGDLLLGRVEGLSSCLRTCRDADGTNPVYCHKTCRKTNAALAKMPNLKRLVTNADVVLKPLPVYRRFSRANMRTDGFNKTAVWQDFTLEQCKKACNALDGCVGFVRDVQTDDMVQGTCYGRTSSDASKCGKLFLNTDWASYIQTDVPNSCPVPA